MKKFLFIFALIFSTTCFAEPIKKIVLFGDSLTDNGNIYKFIKDSTGKGFPKLPPYGRGANGDYPGRFTNGQVWSDIAEKFFKQKFNIDSSNYAVGGATVNVMDPFKKNLPWIIDYEVNDYIFKELPNNKYPADTLYVIWAGANDYTGNRANVDLVTSAVVNTTMATINRLIIWHGARNFLIFNLPDLARTPRAQVATVDADNLHKLSVAHNKKLADAITKLKASRNNVKVAMVDIFNIFNTLVDHPEQINQRYKKSFTNLTESCWAGGYSPENLASNTEKALGSNSNPKLNQLAINIANTPDLAAAYRVGQYHQQGVLPCQNPDNYVFWDEVHPTAPVHDVVAQITIQKIFEEGFMQ